MGTLLGYLIAGLGAVVLLMGGALWYEHQNVLSLTEQKATANANYLKVQEINAHNAAALTQLQSSIEAGNRVTGETLSTIQGFRASAEEFQQKVLTDVPDTDACATSPAIARTFDWLQQRSARASGGGKGGTGPGAGSPARVPVPPSRPFETH
jgi:hypothetical protein